MIQHTVPWVGAFLIEPNDVDLMTGGLFSKNIVQDGVDDIKKIRSSFKQYAVMLESIFDSEACDVLLLHPTYLVKLSGKNWE